MPRLVVLTGLVATMGLSQFVDSASARPLPRWWVRGAMCVHHYEGSWHDKRNPYYRGGMQFAWSTWRSVGGRGDPANASPRRQLDLAHALWRIRGWNPWPNSAALCGLL